MPDDASPLWALPAFRIAALVRSGQISAREAAQAALARIEAANPAINAVVRLTAEDALRDARAVDEAVARGEDPGPLAGVPVTVKENVDQKGHPTTNGLRIQAGLIAAEDNPVVASLRAAGALIVGRTNTPAFSLRWFTRNSLHGATRNPRNPALTPGGSSGGAGAALAAGIGAVAHGTDIGGSIRYPAYACGVHGLRPSLGRVAAANLSAGDRHIGAQLMAVSGPLARSVQDLGLALAAMARPDPRDPWHAPVPLTGPDLPRRAALCPAPEGLAPDPAVEAALRGAAEKLADAGWEVEETDAPPMREAAELQLILWLSEMRRMGPEALEREGDPDALFVVSQLERMCPRSGFEALMDALQRRVTLARAWNLFLERFPVLLCPVSAEPPFPDHLDVSGPEGFARVWRAQLTQLATPLVGLPGLVVTTGAAQTPLGPAPIGVQLIGPRFREDVLLAAGAEIEQRSPPVLPVDPAPADPAPADPASGGAR
ncbi:amidase family protein [Oceanicella actignis]|uniref:amidase family protein n=1 Tax=Oceanicella actignis TaxID=1189325 RepID=UPI0011E6DE0F|nr:amidase family protein [Oceanicella actignis]TYO90674.1 amidase [Oceanicella actignis]